MLFAKKTKPGDYEIVKEGQEEVMWINYNNYPYSPSIEDNSICMSRTIDFLTQNPGVVRIIFSQLGKNYEYDFTQTSTISEIASIYNHFLKQKKVLTLSAMAPTQQCTVCLGSRLAQLQNIILNLLRTDPIGAYVELRRLVREENILIKKTTTPLCLHCREHYINLLRNILVYLDQTKLISFARPHIAGYVLGDRTIYRTIFRPTITPDFMYTKLMSDPPLNGEEIDSYSIDKKTDVTLYRVPGDIKLLYHLNPPEFKISEDKYMLLNLARNVLSEHKPKAEEFVDPERMRRTFYNIGKDLITELATNKGIDLAYKEIEELAEILVRYTVGFGLIEILLNDPKVQDISINGPIGQTPIFLVHADYDECVTNIYPSVEDGEGWATKFRLLSGRPLDEANPVLDTELTLPGSRTRIAIISKPLNPYGLGFSLRRHRDKPWTQPLFVNNKMISPLGAGLLSFLIDGSRTLLVAGTRGSGKCVSGDTLIQLDNGSILPISKLMITENIKEEKKYNLNLGIMSLDNYKIKNSYTDYLYKRRFEKELIKIKTQSGKEIITTPEHPYFTFNMGIKEIYANNIKEGLFIASPRKINTNSEEIEFKFDTKETKDYFIFKGKTNSLEFKFPKKFNSQLSEILGYISGDGHIAKSGIYFFNNNKEIRERYKTLIKELFDIKFREYKTRTTFCVQISSKDLSRLISSIFQIPIGKKSSKLEIPQQVLKSNNEILASYIKTLFDCDSHVSEVDIEFTSASNQLVKQLQMALLRFGIISFEKLKIVKNKPYYRLFIRGDSIKSYNLNINYNHPMKKDNLLKISFKKSNTNVDIIPQGTKLFGELRNKLHISPKQLKEILNKDYWGYENNKYGISRNWFNQIMQYFNVRYNQISSINIRPLYNILNYNLKEITSEIKELKTLLDIPYSELSAFLKISDKEVNKLLNQKCKNSFLKSTINLTSMNQLFENKINNFGTNINYSEMSRATNIPESSLKSYFYGGIKTPTERKIIIDNFLEQHRSLLEENKNKANIIINSIKNKYRDNSIDYIQIGIILNNLRNELNIPNEMIASKDISIQTVSNFFNGIYKNISINTLKAITKNIINIYEEVISDETSKLLELANNVVNSDLFWDKVISVERVKSSDGYVYDLSVPGTHNFIANGIIAHNTSFLDSCLIEIMRKYRIITCEDTLELSTEKLRELGYNIQPLKVRSALAGGGGSEIAADEGIRTSLRMGDSSLIVGEIRSLEALALFEAMRVGALANVVAGTIHGDSPYGVFDRIVNDLKVPRTSFKAVDIIVISNPIKSPDGMHRWRRITQITEVRKQWNEDPMAEGGFVDLMKYDAKTDSLQPTDALINGESEIIKSIASNIKEWAGNWEAVWDNILLRAKIKETFVNYAIESGMIDLLEAKDVVQFNDLFHRISDEVRQETGTLDSKKIFFRWEQELKRYIKQKTFENGDINSKA
ncbi:MAG: ATPase, T2SS/T4P/T4SS family [Candidatus Nanoarchaeia archaeon]|nr:ATPase, T2SS/T4P/T4SS family [Candidatus Nanoarchaeia archaeon]